MIAGSVYDAFYQLQVRQADMEDDVREYDRLLRQHKILQAQYDDLARENAKLKHRLRDLQELQDLGIQIAEWFDTHYKH